MEMSTLVSMRKVITLTFTLQIKLFLIICYWNEQSGFFNIENAWKSYFYIRHIRDLDWVFLHCIENSYPCCPYSCMYDCFSGFWIKMRIMSRDNKHTKILVQKKWNNVFPSFGFHSSLFIFQVTWKN